MRVSTIILGRREAGKRSAPEEPKVCRLSAGGRWIRTSGTAAQKPWISAALPSTPSTARKLRFACDSLLEGAGSELPVPGFWGGKRHVLALD
jgi:hypothetical protein